MAYRAYKDDLTYNKDNAKILFQPDYLIKNMLNQHEHSEASGANLIDFIEPFSPVDELAKSSKVVRTGKGGVPSKQAFRKEHRNIHPSYIGNIAAHSTTESSDVGLVNYHTLGSFISKDYGFYGNKLRDPNNSWDTVSIDEALIPFQNSMDSTRLIVARTHMCQKVPILNGEPPLVQSGAEYIVPQLTSSKFAHRANKNGKVTKVEADKFIHVLYEDGSKEVFDLIPRMSTTKRSSIIRITLDTLKEGDSFQTGQLIAWSKSFVDNVLAIGKNKKVAVLNYLGNSHEDGYVISENMANDFLTEMVIKVPVIVPPNTKILYFNRNKETVLNDTLIEFQYNTEENPEDYLNTYDLIDSEFQEDVESLYTSKNDSVIIKSPGGEIVDIKIKINNKTLTDRVLLNEWESQNENINNIKKQVNQNNFNHEEKLLDNIDTSVIKVGSHKLKGKPFEGCLVEFYIKIINPIKIGNKIANRFGAKGVINHIIPQDIVPLAEYTGELDIFLAPAAILGRKNTVIVKELYLGKLLINLKSIVANYLAKDKIDNAKQAISTLYTILDKTGKHVKLFNEIFKSDPNLTELEAKLTDPKFNFNFIIPPFDTIKFKDIQTVAKKLNIPLDEKVYIKELDMWTKTPVPVGYSYISTMEQLSSDYESTRSKAGYVGATGQPVKGRAKMGGQNLGNLDIYNLITYDAKNMLTEMMTVRSDNMKAKHEVLYNIMEYGHSAIPTEIKKGKTQDLFKIMMLSIGLDIKGKF